jgi:hypothetical protein
MLNPCFLATGGHPMNSLRRPLLALLTALTLCLLACGAARADEREDNELAWREYRSLKREQVAELCDLWFAQYRPGSIGKTYVELAGRYAHMDLSRCSPALRSHLRKAEKTSTQIGELFGQGTMPDLRAVLTMTRFGAGLESSCAVSSERGLRVLELLRELSASEDAVIRELHLDE